DMPCDVFLKHLNLVKKHLFALEDAISAEKLEKDGQLQRLLCKGPGSRILTLLAKGGDRGIATEKEDLKHITQLVRRASDVLTHGQETANSGGQYLEKIQSLLLTAFQHDKEELDKNYQLLIYEEEPEKKGTKRKAVDFFTADGTRPDGNTPRRLCLWCFSCSVAMRELLKHEVHSVIVTSGTLSPISSTAEAFGVPFPVVLENSHVIDPRKQLFGALLAKGPTEVSLDASYSRRNDLAYIKELGATVQRLASASPEGMLLAFSSYGMKDSVLEAWRQHGILEEISREKPIFEEPKGSNETKQVMEQYNKALDRGSVTPRGDRCTPTILELAGTQRMFLVLAVVVLNGGPGAILAAVCRGKLCEGIDFTDKQCRMVVMVGIPYPAKNDLRVILKQDFLDCHLQGSGILWYQREAMRAVNQTLGRVIRHRQDYGAAVLCDARFGGRMGGLSSWLRPQVSLMAMDAAVQACRRFFGLAEAAPRAEAAEPRAGERGAAPGANEAAAPAPAAAKNASKALNLARELWRGAQSFREDLRCGATPQSQLAPSQPSAQAPRKKKPLEFKRTAFQPARPVEEEQWLESAEKLLPRMDMADLRKSLSIVRRNSSDAVDGSAQAMSAVMEALRECASCLQPAWCYDTPEEERGGAKHWCRAWARSCRSCCRACGAPPWRRSGRAS
ncbi:unnamed protein product, partial [Effrenium voratum]